MKIPFVLVCTCAIFSIKRAHGSAIHTPFYPLDPEDLSEGEIKELEYWDKYYHRPKRSGGWSPSGSGSGDILNQIKSAVVAGIAKKVGQFAKGSAGALAGASAGFSKGSSVYEPKHHPTYDHPTYDHIPESYDHKSFNFWELKKSVLNTLLQAVKAIKGGVLAIKGQLIKGSGFIVSGGGKLISSSGDVVTKLGKNIISNAVLIPPHKGHAHSEYGPPSSSYIAASAPPGAYEAPSASGPAYVPESHYHESHYDHHDDKLSHGSQAGILILRRIPSDPYKASHSHIEESKVPLFKPLSPTGPGLGSIVGKFFTASTSLDPQQPTPFGDTAPGAVVYNTHGDSKHYAAENSHSSLTPPSPPHFEEPRHKHLPAPHVESILSPTSSNGDFSTSSDFGGSIQPQSDLATNYGTPFEEAPSFFNYNDHLRGEASNVKEQKVKLTLGEELDKQAASATISSSEVQLPKDAPSSLNVLKQSLKNRNVRRPYSGEILDSSVESIIKSSDNLPNPSTTNFLQSALYPQEQGSVTSDQAFDNSDKHHQYFSSLKQAPFKSSFSQKLVSSASSLENFLPQESPKFAPNSKETFDGFSKHENYQHLADFPFEKLHPSSSTRTKSSKPSPSHMRLRVQTDKRPRRPDYHVMKSISYELTPEGPKRLT